jgi:ABC-type sugar transport system ATPase subunit
VHDISRSGEFENVSFDLKKGEILGFAGLIGAGRSELAKAIFGATRLSKGTIEINGGEGKDLTTLVKRSRTESPISPRIAKGRGYSSKLQLKRT